MKISISKLALKRRTNSLSLYVKYCVFFFFETPSIVVTSLKSVMTIKPIKAVKILSLQLDFYRPNNIILEVTLRVNFFPMTRVAHTVKSCYSLCSFVGK